MTKQTISESDGIHKEWYEQAKEQTLETLEEFLRHLTDDYYHDYGTICHAITAGAIGAAWAIEHSPQGGITGFQAGAIMWEFIKNWMRKNPPMVLLEYRDLLYPQYIDRFTTISRTNADWLMEEAKKELKTGKKMAPRVLSHMEAIAGGWLPMTVRGE